MEFKSDSLPKLILGSDLNPGDLFFVTSNTGPVAYLVVEDGGEIYDMQLAVDGVQAIGPQPEGFRRPSRLYVYDAPFVITAIGSPDCSDQYVPPGTLTIAQNGTFVRHQFSPDGGVSYYDLSSGRKGDPSSPRLFQPAWALSLDLGDRFHELFRMNAHET